jgi:pimeloyl-ACP methyl ester carboxylesterase
MPIFLLIDWLLKQPKLARRLFDNVRQKETLRKILESIYPSNPAAVDDDLVDLLHDPSCDVGALETFVSVITGPPGPRPEELVPKISSPMLILWGDADNFTPSDGPVGRYFQQLPASKPGTQFVHLPGVGHAPMDEAPEAVLRRLLPWLEGLNSS